MSRTDDPERRFGTALNPLLSEPVNIVLRLCARSMRACRDYQIVAIRILKDNRSLAVGQHNALGVA